MLKQPPAAFLERSELLPLTIQPALKTEDAANLGTYSLFPAGAATGLINSLSRRDKLDASDR
jgi:hypothetical protein